MAGFKMDDYVDVAERIRQFYERYPDGRLVTGSLPHVVEIAGKPYVWYHARAYRTPDDPLPGDGWAAEPVPGPTQFTKDSELMNAETAAWGRAIVALGFETKKIASAQEVRNRSTAYGSEPVTAQSNGAGEFETLSARLVELADQLGAKDATVDLLADHVGDVGWVKRQIVTAEKNVATRAKA